MRTLLLSVFGFTALVAASRPVRADVTLFTEVDDGGKKQDSTLYLATDHLRIQSAERGGVIFDGTAKKLIMLHPQKKTYTEMTAATMQKMRGAMGGLSPQVKAAMAARMATMTPDQRARMEAMMAQNDAATGGTGAAPAPRERQLAFEKMGSKKTVNGFSCEMYRVTQAGQPFEEDCMAPFGAATFTREDAAVFRSIAESMREMLGVGQASPVDDFSKYPGVPVERKRLNSTPPGQVETIKRIQHGKVDAGLFLVPAGYTLEHGGLGAMGGGH